MAKKTVREILPKKTLILRQDVGQLKDESGNAYEATLRIPDMCPVIQSPKTGKWFILSWQDIVHLAVEAGIDK